MGNGRARRLAILLVIIVAIASVIALEHVIKGQSPSMKLVYEYRVVGGQDKVSIAWKSEPFLSNDPYLGVYRDAFGSYPNFTLVLKGVYDRTSEEAFILAGSVYLVVEQVTYTNYKISLVASRVLFVSRGSALPAGILDHVELRGAMRIAEVLEGHPTVLADEARISATVKLNLENWETWYAGKWLGTWYFTLPAWAGEGFYIVVPLASSQPASLGRTGEAYMAYYHSMQLRDGYTTALPVVAIGWEKEYRGEIDLLNHEFLSIFGTDVAGYYARYWNQSYMTVEQTPRKLNIRFSTLEKLPISREYNPTWKTLALSEWNSSASGTYELSLIYYDDYIDYDGMLYRVVSSEIPYAFYYDEEGVLARISVASSVIGANKPLYDILVSKIRGDSSMVLVPEAIQLAVAGQGTGGIVIMPYKVSSEAGGNPVIELVLVSKG